MTDDTRVYLAFFLAAVGVGWCIIVEVMRDREEVRSNRIFLLWLTAPIIAIVLIGIGLWLMFGTEKIRRARGLIPPAATRPAAR